MKEHFYDFSEYRNVSKIKVGDIVYFPKWKVRDSHPSVKAGFAVYLGSKLQRTQFRFLGPREGYVQVVDIDASEFYVCVVS